MSSRVSEISVWSAGEEQTNGDRWFGFPRESFICVLFEVGIVAFDALFLVLNSGSAEFERVGGAFRTDMTAFAFCASSFLGLFTIVIADTVTAKAQTGRFKVDWPWAAKIMRIFFQTNAVMLSLLVLLGYATLAFVQVMTVGASMCLTIGVSSAVAWAWQRGLQDKVPEASRVPVIRAMLTIRLRIKYFVAWLLFGGIAYSAMYFKTSDQLGLSSEVQKGEHFVLFYIGSTMISSVLGVLFLGFTRRGRRLLVWAPVLPMLESGKVGGDKASASHAALTPPPLSHVKALTRAFILSLGAHIVGGMMIMAFFAVIVICIVIGLVQLALREARDVKPIPKTLEELEEEEREKQMQTKGSKEERRALRKKKDQQQMFASAKRSLMMLGLLSLGLFKVVAVFLVFVFDVHFISKHLSKDSASCTARAAATAAVEAGNTSGVNSASWGARRRLHVAEDLQGASHWDEFSDSVDSGLPLAGLLEEHELGLSGDAETRDIDADVLRRLAEDTSSGWLVPSAPFELGNGTMKVLNDIGLSRAGDAIGKAINELTDWFSWLLSKEMYVPESIELKCTGVRRMASASAVFGCVAIVLGVGLMDVLSVLAATKEIAQYRAGASGSFLRYVLVIARVQGIEFTVLQVLQITVASGSRLKFEIVGFYDQECGYLVNSVHLAGTDCPSPWHSPVDFVAGVMVCAGITLAVIVFLSVLSGSLYGLPMAKWVMEAFFGRHLKLSNFGGERTQMRNNGLLSKKLEKVPLLQAVIRPLLGIGVSIGIWTTWSSRLYQCGMRQDWYEPVSAGDEGGGEAPMSSEASENNVVNVPSSQSYKDDDAEGAHQSAADLVSWKAMYQATAKMIAVVWTPMPFFGALMSKSVIYLNEHVLLAFGDDGGSGGCGSDAKRGSIIKHFMEEQPRSVHSIHWASQSLLVFILLVIEFDLLKSLSTDQRLTALGICMVMVFLIAVVGIVIDLSSALKGYKAARGIIDAAEEVVRTDAIRSIAKGTFHPDTDPLKGLPAMDRQRIVTVCKELMELPWCKQQKLPREQRTGLISAKMKGSLPAQLAIFALKAQARSASNVTDALVGATVILAIHDVAKQDIVTRRAFRGAKLRARENAIRTARERGVALQQWLVNKAKTDILSEARKRAKLYKQWRRDGRPFSPVDTQRSVHLTLKASTQGIARVTAQWKSNARDLLDAPQESRKIVRAQVKARIQWASRTDPSNLTEKDVQISASWHEVAQDEDNNNSNNNNFGATVDAWIPEDMEKGVVKVFKEGDLLEKGSLAELEEEMRYHASKGSLCTCCTKRGEAMPLSPSSPLRGAETYEATWVFRELGTVWVPEGTAVLKSTQAQQAAGVADANLHIERDVWPDCPKQPSDSPPEGPAPSPEAAEAESAAPEQPPLDLGEQERLFEQLQAAIRNAIYAPQTLLHAGAFLSGLSMDKDHRDATLAARRIRLLGVVKRMTDARERRLKMLDEQAAAAEDEKGDLEQTFKQLEIETSEIEVEPYSPIDTRIQSLEKLREALARDPPDPDELSKRLDDARRADVDPMVLSSAQERFMEILDRQEAALDMASALEGGMIRDLRASIKKARAHGVLSADFPDPAGVGLLEKVKKKLVVAEEGVNSSLREAIDLGGAAKLQHALAQAEEAEIEDGEGLVQRASARLRSIESRKRRIAKLKIALNTNDASLLRATIEECQLEDRDGEVDLTQAMKRLQILERSTAKPDSGQALPAFSDGAPLPLQQTRAIGALRAALFQEPLEVDMLKLAVKQAEDAGLSDSPELMRARSMLEAETAKAKAVLDVREAANRKDTKALREAIASAHQLGVHPSKLLSAISRLLEEQTRVAQLAGDHGIGNIVLSDVERERRDLHNRLMDLQGGLRTVVRIRPLALGAGATGASASSSQRSHGSGPKGMPGMGGHGAGIAMAGAAAVLGGSGGAAQLFGAIHESGEDEASMTSGAASGAGGGETLPAVIRVDRHTLAVSKVSARSNANSGRDDSFRFGAVLGPDAVQAEVFAEARGLAQSAIDGYNVLVLACGPPGGGRTHSLLGEGTSSSDGRGLAPRMIDELFAIREHDAWRAHLEVDLQVVSVIDNNEMQDILGLVSTLDLQGPQRGVIRATPQRIAAGVHSVGSAAVRLAPQDLLGAGGGGGGGGGAPAASDRVMIEGVMTRRVSSAREMKEMMQECFQLKASSGRPGHLTTIVSLARTNIATGSMSRSKLVFTDLIGLGQKSPPTVVAAYKALDAVLKALAAKRQRIPFREHLLTQVIQDCLGGTAKTLLLLALPPERQQRADSMLAIAMASRAAR